VHRQPHGLAAGVAGATGSSGRWGGSWGLFAVGSVSSNVQRTCMGYAATQNRACNTITHPDTGEVRFGCSGKDIGCNHAWKQVA